MNKNTNAVTGAGNSPRVPSISEQLEVINRNQAHNARSALNAIIGNTMAVRDMSTNEGLREFAGIIEGIARQGLI